MIACIPKLIQRADKLTLCIKLIIKETLCRTFHMFVCIPKLIFRSSVASSRLYILFLLKRIFCFEQSFFAGYPFASDASAQFPIGYYSSSGAIEPQGLKRLTEELNGLCPRFPLCLSNLSNLTLLFWTCWILEPNANYYAGSDDYFFSNLEKLNSVTLDSNRIPLGTLAIEPPTLLENYYFLLLLLYKFIH